MEGQPFKTMENFNNCLGITAELSVFVSYKTTYVRSTKPMKNYVSLLSVNGGQKLSSST